ncbi:MAG: type II secretion system protein J [Sutterella sp.]
MRNNEKGFTLLEIAVTLIIVGIIGLSVTGALTRIVQDFVVARAVAERMPVVDASLSVIRRGLERTGQIESAGLSQTEDKLLQMQTDGGKVSLLQGAQIKALLNKTEYVLNNSDEAVKELRLLSLIGAESELPAFNKPVWWDVTVTVSISDELPPLDFPISVGK